MVSRIVALGSFLSVIALPWVVLCSEALTPRDGEVYFAIGAWVLMGLLSAIISVGEVKKKE